MSSSATVTILKMIEMLPEQFQDRVVEHLREYIEDLRDEASWNNSFSGSQERLIGTARQARKEIAQGKATPLDLKKL